MKRNPTAERMFKRHTVAEWKALGLHPKAAYVISVHFEDAEMTLAEHDAIRAMGHEIFNLSLPATLSGTARMINLVAAVAQMDLGADVHRGPAGAHRVGIRRDLGEDGWGDTLAMVTANYPGWTSPVWRQPK